MVSMAHPRFLLFPELVVWVLLRLSLIDPNCLTDRGLNVELIRAVWKSV